MIIVSATGPDQAAFSMVLDRLAASRAGTSRRSNNQEKKSAGLAPKSRSAAVVPSDQDGLFHLRNRRQFDAPEPQPEMKERDHRHRIPVDPVKFIFSLWLRAGRAGP